MSINHSFPELQDHVYQRYIKADLGRLSGVRPNPHNISQRLHWLLETPETLVNFKKDNDGFDVVAGRKPIDYDDEVLETYSVEEDRAFRRMNKEILETGALIEYSGEQDEVSAMSDKELDTIVSNFQKFKSAIKVIEDLHVLERIKQRVLQKERNKTWLDLIESRINDVTTESIA
jgi:hypothetical protein